MFINKKILVHKIESKWRKVMQQTRILVFLERTDNEPSRYLLVIWGEVDDENNKEGRGWE